MSWAVLARGSRRSFNRNAFLKGHNMLQLLTLLILFPQQSGDLLDAVNSERGGRHWIDQKPAPAKSTAESQKCFQIEPGSRIELAAAEPLVFDPVWIDFDHRGRMFAAEYSDYPIGPVNADGTANETASPLSKIVMLEDEDGDGQMDKRTIFADKLQFCHSFMPLMDGILACAQTQILFLKDTDGDNVADVREVWFDGFVPAHAQMQIGCPRFGMDNWIYLTYAPGDIVCRRPGFETTEPVKLPRQDMRFHPLTMTFESVSGLGQFGNTIDNDGNRFFSTNRNPIMMEMIPEAAAKRNPYATISTRHTDVGPSGGDTRVFPLVDMKSNWLAHAGTHTSACGVSAYRGDLWNDGFQHSVFVCEPVGHLVTRSIVGPLKGSPALTATRARENADFLASSDTWFRPGSMRTGPDGALYLADMYRMWVEHPKFLPPEIAAQIDWRAGEDKGRIWRIVPEGHRKAPSKFVAPTTVPEMIKLLEDTNGWRRQTAQRLLLERFAGQIVPMQVCGLCLEVTPQDVAEASMLLRTLLRSDDSSAASRHHALQCLDGLDAMTEADLLAAMKDSSPIVRSAASNLSLRWLDVSSSLRAAGRSLLLDADARVQLTALLNIRSAPPNWPVHAGTEVMMSPLWSDKWFQQAALSVAHEQAEMLTAVLAARSGIAGYPESKDLGDHTPLIGELAAVVAAAGNERRLLSVLQIAANERSANADVAAVLKGLDQGARRNKGPLAYRTLSSLLTAPPESLKEPATEILARIDRVAAVGLNRDASVIDQQGAMNLMAVVKPADFLQRVPEFLTAGQPQKLQQTTIELVRQSGNADAALVVLARFQQLAPAPRKSAVDLILTRIESTIELLTKMKSGEIPSGLIDIDQRVRLLQHKDDGIKTLAGEIFGGVVSSNRKAVADEYQPALTMAASAERGAAVFKKTCIKCHKIDGQGHNVGPDISDTRRRTRDALLYDILDPNRRVDPQFSEYVVITTDGLTLNGLLVSDSEDQIVLRQPEGKERSVDRTDIEEMRATSKSLMPEGIEKEVTVQQMADLLEFLKSS